MTIGEIATVRTGLVAARKKKSLSSNRSYQYKLLNLKCISNDGHIEPNELEQYEISEKLKDDYLTQSGDILIRLSTPYTVVLIDRKELCGIVIPSHFAVIRVDRKLVTPEYVFWQIRRDKNRITMMQNSSGGAAFATISSGLIANLDILLLPLSSQKKIGDLMILTEREQDLQCRLIEAKKKFNTALLNKIYDKVKRGNE